MKSLLEYRKYDPKNEYQEDTRREVDLDRIRRGQEYRDILELGFEEVTSHQQEINNTIKFQRKNQPEVEGFGEVFYTIHPTGVVRRYNPREDRKNDETPQGEGNTIRTYPSPFRNSREYKKALRYLFNYIRRKELRGDYR